jgi:hypothetical protein
MNKTVAAWILAACTLLALPGTASAAANVKCTMTFRISGWSVFYKASDGTGTIKCSNGQSMAVKLKARGGGLTVGKSTIDKGRGDFSAVSNIKELLGVYASAEAQAGAVKSAKAQVVTKGEVSLALSGTGSGWDLGVAIGSFEISRR